jgi:hypothetical protein
MDAVEVPRHVVDAQDVVAARELVVHHAEALAVHRGGFGARVRVLGVRVPGLAFGDAQVHVGGARAVAREQLYVDAPARVTAQLGRVVLEGLDVHQRLRAAGLHG